MTWRRALVAVALGTIRNPGLTRATALDMNGMPAGAVALKRSAAQVEFRFPVGAMYAVLR